MAYYGPFPYEPALRQMGLRGLSPQPTTPAAAMQQRWQNPMGEYANTPMQQPTMASVRTKRIFGINVPQRTIQSVVGGLAAGLAAGADGNFAEGFAGGLGGSLGGGMLYDRQMRLEQEAQAQAERAAQQAAMDERGMRIREAGLLLDQQRERREAAKPPYQQPAPDYAGRLKYQEDLLKLRGKYKTPPAAKATPEQKAADKRQAKKDQELSALQLIDDPAELLRTSLRADVEPETRNAAFARYQRYSNPQNPSQVR